MRSSNAIFRPSSEPKIELSNDGQLQVIFLGTGSAFATERYQSNIFIVKGSTHVMIDLGTKAALALNEGGLNVMNIQNLLVTHSHADHIGGIEELCLKSRYAPKADAGGHPKPTLLTTEDYASILWDCSLRGGLEHSEEKSSGRRLKLSDYMDLRFGEIITGLDRPAYKLKIGEGKSELSLTMMRTNHIPDCSYSWQTAFYSVGVLVDDRVFISGDTMFDKDLIETFGESAEVIFHDCQDYRGGVHASYEELCSLPKYYRQKMFLYHLPDGIENKIEPADRDFAGWTKPFNRGSYILE